MILLDSRPAVTVDCPDCECAGETTIPGTVERDVHGVWDRDTETCTGCHGSGVVPADQAIEVTCCTTVLTRWRGDRCPEHEDLCDEHAPACPGCADTDDEPRHLGADPWGLGGAA